MIIPWRVDVPEERYPFFNWIIIAGAVAAFVFQIMSIRERSAQLPDKIREYSSRPVEDVAKDFGVEQKRLKEIEESVEKAAKKVEEIVPQKDISALKDTFVKKAILEEYFVWGGIRPFILSGLTIKGLFGHIWLHGGILHLLGNMLFLWIFGNAVCAKIGNFCYFPIYIGLGLVAGIAHLIFTGGNALGASGAINGIVGMYLVFFPENEITCYFIFFFPIFIRPYMREFCVSSIWMILFWLVFDIWGAIRGGGQVAYFAHLGGFAGGVVIAILMLKFKMVTMERYEKSLLQMWADYRNPPKDDTRPYGDGYLDVLQREMQEVESIAKNPPKQKTIAFEPPIPKEEFIRFTCQCGKRLKMPIKYAGKTGRCPKCNARVRIPDK